MEQARQRVMVVDDAPDFVETIRPVLEEAGYAVVAACNGAECMATLDQTGYVVKGLVMAVDRFR